MARVKNTLQMIEVMQAYLNWYQCDYRVKQEPREFAVVIDREGKAIGVSEAADGSIITVPGDKIRDAKVIRVREVLNND